MREVVRSDESPASPLFPQAVRAGDFIFVSGTTGIDPASGQLAGASIEAQVERALENCRAVLTAAGSGLEDVVEVGVLLADPDDFDGVNDVWSRWFEDLAPTRWVGRLGPVLPGVLVSVRMTAYNPR